MKTAKSTQTRYVSQTICSSSLNDARSVSSCVVNMAKTASHAPSAASQLLLDRAPLDVPSVFPQSINAFKLCGANACTAILFATSPRARLARLNPRFNSATSSHAEFATDSARLRVSSITPVVCVPSPTSLSTLTTSAATAEPDPVPRSPPPRSIAVVAVVVVNPEAPSPTASSSRRVVILSTGRPVLSLCPRRARRRVLAIESVRFNLEKFSPSVRVALAHRPPSLVRLASSTFVDATTNSGRGFFNRLERVKPTREIDRVFSRFIAER